MKRVVTLLLTALVLLTLIPGVALAENKFYFDKNYSTVFEGEDLQLIMIRQGDCAEEGDLSFKTSNRKVATVDEYGVVNGLTKGTATSAAVPQLTTMDQKALSFSQGRTSRMTMGRMVSQDRL